MVIQLQDHIALFCSAALFDEFGDDFPIRFRRQQTFVSWSSAPDDADFVVYGPADDRIDNDVGWRTTLGVSVYIGAQNDQKSQCEACPRKTLAQV